MHGVSTCIISNGLVFKWDDISGGFVAWAGL